MNDLVMRTESLPKLLLGIPREYSGRVNGRSPTKSRDSSIDQLLPQNQTPRRDGQPHVVVNRVNMAAKLTLGRNGVSEGILFGDNDNSKWCTGTLSVEGQS